MDRTFTNLIKKLILTVLYIAILVKQVYWYIFQISGEHLEDHWSSGVRLLP